MDTLQKICADKRVDIAAEQTRRSFTSVDREARDAPSPRPFAAALASRVRSRETAFITEIKKASPSAGKIRDSFSPCELAKAYASAGAACLSVLTEKAHFMGRPQDLIEARAACDLPVLRKDFMLDPWQIAESRAMGADCILLIMASLEDAEAAELHAAARDYGMDILVEVHDERELTRALKLPSGIIGINNRNLKTLSIDLSTTSRVSTLVPKDRLKVSESGIRSPDDVSTIRRAGVDCFLVGESLLRQSDVALALQKLRASP